MILKPIAPSEREALHLKILAAESLNGGRAEWGYSRVWKGHYLAEVCIWGRG